jgi:hypothetical protein
MPGRLYYSPGYTRRFFVVGYIIPINIPGKIFGGGFGRLGVSGISPVTVISSVPVIYYDYITGGFFFGLFFRRGEGLYFWSIVINRMATLNTRRIRMKL